MKIIKSLSLILLVMAVGTTGVYAYDFEKDGIYYNILSEEERTVEVTNQSDWGGGYRGEIVIPQRVINDGKTYSVTTIGDAAFYNCEALKSVSMPSITTISDRAFLGCNALTSVDMPAVTTIGNAAFSGCYALTSVSMPAVTTIGNAAFGGCYALTSVSMPKVTTIGDVAFCECLALTSVSMPEVTTIGYRAFDYCIALTSVSMPKVTTICEYTFRECYALTSVDMSKVTTIGEYAFADCSALTFVNIPSSCTSIAANPFIGCIAMKEIVVDDNNPNYSSKDGVLYDKYVGTLIACAGGIDYIEIPSSVTRIDYEAFSGCSALTSLDIPASVSMIGNDAFDGCNSLTAVYCHWEQPLECDPGFTDEALMNATLYVPVGTIDAYGKVDPWRNFWNIEERDYSGITDATASELVIKVIGGAIVIEGGDGTSSALVVEVYSAGGGCVYRGTDSSIGGLTHGVYVVKVGGTVQKVAL